MDKCPSEILLSILRRLPDLESLDNVLRASPTAWRLFGKYGSIIMQDVLEAASIHEHVLVVMCTIASVRQGSFPIITVAEFQRRVTDPALWHGSCPLDEDGEHPIEDPYAPVQIPKDTSPAVMRSLLATARHLALLTFTCLEFYLNRYRQLQPHVPADSSYDMGPIEKRSVLQLRIDNPTRVRYKIVDTGPPTWSEEQLVYRAFWRIQLVQDLSKASLDGTLPNWTGPEMDRLRSMDIVSIYDFQRIEDEVYLRDCYLGSTFPGEQHEDLTEYNLILTVMDFLRERQYGPSHACLPRSRPWAVPNPLTNDETTLAEHWNLGAYWFEHAFGRFKEVQTFRHFRCLGFAIWTAERLNGYGLGGSFNPSERGPDLSAWLSILPQEHVTRLERWEEDLKATSLAYRLQMQQKGSG